MNKLLGLITPARVAAFQAWRKQPTTIAGIATATSTVSALASGQITWRHAVVVLIGAAIAMVLEDNTAPLAALTTSPSK